MRNAREVSQAQACVSAASTGCAPYLASCRASSTTMVVLLGDDSV